MHTNDKIFGIDLVIAYDLEIDKKYKLVNDNTNYLKNIALKDVKDIKFSYFLDTIILLKNGDLFINGKKLQTKGKYLHFVDGMSIFLIDNKNRLLCLTSKDNSTKLLNNNNYEYKKIILTPLAIVALTYENTIKCYGNFLDAFIDYARFFEVEDIGYIKDNDDIVVIKNNKIYSLFSNYDYSNSTNDIVIYEQVDINLNDIMIISRN